MRFALTRQKLVIDDIYLKWAIQIQILFDAFIRLESIDLFISKEKELFFFYACIFGAMTCVNSSSGI